MVSKEILNGDLAQLVEHLLCKQGVRGSTPLVSTQVETASQKWLAVFLCPKLRRGLTEP